VFALRGDAFTPASRWDRTSLGIFQPRRSLATWLGRTRADGRIPIYNLFNRTPTSIDDGWSVRKTQVRDFRGGRLTYDSHNGTDFIVPPGTVVVAAAPARVAHVRSEFHRGGLKVVLDHGDGLVTTSNHLARALVRPGETVARGQPIARSGASGVDFLLTLPWSAPHVHWNVWLDGAPVDPFATDGEVALWRTGNDPAPHAPGDAIRGVPAQSAGSGAPGVPAQSAGSGPPVPPSVFDAAAVADAIAGCRDDVLRERLAACEPLADRALETLFQMNYFPTRFVRRPCVYAERHPRAPRLDLPFRAIDFRGVAFD
jgi:murein DD-endopeptidase